MRGEGGGEREKVKESPYFLTICLPRPPLPFLITLAAQAMTTGKGLNESVNKEIASHD